jgi:glycosyltransferase involved in cell wall biosynthesis
MTAHSSKFREVRHTVGLLLPVSLKRKIYERLNEARFRKLLRAKQRFRTQSSSATPRGINLVGYIRAESGLGAAARGMASALEFAGIPFNVINLESGNYSRHTDLTWSHKEVRRSDYDISVVCVNPDQSFHLRTQVPVNVLGNRYVIGYWFWELPELPDEWMDAFAFTDEVWAASRFIGEAVSRKSSVPVVHIPPVVTLNQGKTFSRSELGLPERSFLFLAMFDTRSVLQRKNPLGVLRAFKAAFPRDDSASVALVMRFNNADPSDPVFQGLQEEMAGHENIVVLDGVMDRDEVTSLIKACDCFVSLHRSEGFGLGPAEAMSLGKPAIVTNWSGNIDYMTEDNSIAIDYELVKLGQDYGPYKAHQHWAEPDLEQAAHWMKKIVHDPDLAKRIGARAQETIHSNFSPDAVGKKIQARLEEIRGEERPNTRER